MALQYPPYDNTPPEQMGVSSQRILNPVRVASVANVDISSLAAEDLMDTVALENGDRLLLKNQSDASENGIYVLEQSGATRSEDMTSSGQIATGVVVPVLEGSANAGKAFSIVAPAGEIGSVDLAVTAFSAWFPAEPSDLGFSAMDSTPPEAVDLSAMIPGNDAPETLDLSSMSYTTDPPESFSLS